MNEKEFDSIARHHFSQVLVPLGFTCEGSRYSNFYRKVSEEIFHFVFPDLGRGGSWYDVKVFASSPKIDPQFFQRLPDDTGIPSGSLCFLNPKTGVGPNQKRFHCKSEAGFTDGFQTEVVPALMTFGIPFLEGITSLSGLVPTIKQDTYLGLALWHSGEREAARPIIDREIERLTKVQDSTGRVAAFLNELKQLS